MALSTRRIPVINTIPILSVAGVFTYTFEVANAATIQVLWAQFTQVNGAGGAARIPIMQIFDDTATLVYQITYFTSIAGGGTLLVTWNQGNTIIPNSVLGRNTSYPTDGIFVKDQWEMSFFSLNTLATDVFTGAFQTRGLHNGDQIQ